MTDTRPSDLVAVAISMIALGWTIYESVSTRRTLKRQEQLSQVRVQQSEYRALLDNFLLPLQATLARSKFAFESLVDGPGGGVQRLEYYPLQLRTHFDSLSDSRRIFWQVEINQIHGHNEAAIRLIDGFASNDRLSAEFRSASEEFRRHAHRWRMIWDAIGNATIGKDQLPGELIADPFPEAFDAIVAREERNLRSAAGLSASNLPGYPQ